ncbi:MAG: hypothetical protein GX491_18900 [Chloroflexi bacterium]|nr:hypothetical protein [Chloroflexota bacterium]
MGFVTSKGVLACLKTPLFYLGLLIINFGIFIPAWGLYGDDWQYLYSYHLLGAAGYPAFVAPDRPFSAWVYMLFTPLLGETPWAYHILLLMLRWSAAVLFWKVLLAMWPRQIELAFWAGALLAIYPGFRQQPLPLEFILHFSVLNLTLFSLFCMLRSVAVQTGSRRWTVPGVISALGIFSVEYFAGLELLRPVLLWVKLQKSHPRPADRLKAAALRWLPYLAVFAAFGIWRVCIFKFQHYKPSTEGLSNPLKYLLMTGWKALGDLWLALAKSWEFQISIDRGLPFALVSLAVLFTSFFIIYLVIRKVYPSRPPELRDQTAEYIRVAVVGFTALALAGPLYWILDIPIQQTFPWDRPLLSFMPGAAILLSCAAVRMLVPRYREVFLAGLCAVAVIANFQNASTYAAEWQAVRAYLDQMTRRIPQVEPGTILLTQDLPFLYYGENTFFPILNWIYDPDNHTPQMRMRMFDLSIRQGEPTAALERGEVVEHNYRAFQFASDREHVVAITYQPPACLHVLSPDDAAYPHLPKALADLAYLSKPELIQVDAGTTPGLPAVLGGEVSLSWCAYYAEAQLARQQQDWDSVRSIAAAAESQGFQPQVGYEYLPFMEAFARSGEWDQVERYFQRAAASSDEAGRDYLCSRWNSLTESLDQSPARRLAAQYCSE